MKAFVLAGLLSIAPFLSAMARVSCEIPDYSKDLDAWSKVDHLEIVRIRSTDESGVEIIRGDCPLPSLKPGSTDNVPNWCAPKRELSMGGMAILLKRYGAYACIIGAMGRDRTYWIKQEELENANARYAGDKNWADAYRRYPSFDQIDITRVQDGRYIVSGGVIASAGEGYQCGFFELAQIDKQVAHFTNKLARLRSIRVNLAVSTCNSRNIKTQMLGRVLDGCELLLKKLGPFLFVREKGICNYRSSDSSPDEDDQRSGFQGLWTRDLSETPKPRKDHSLNMRLGR